MNKITFGSWLMVAFTAFGALASCNNRGSDIPFPKNDSVWSKPLSQPLQLSAPKKLNWVTVKTGVFFPVLYTPCKQQRIYKYALLCGVEADDKPAVLSNHFW